MTWDWLIGEEDKWTDDSPQGCRAYLKRCKHERKKEKARGSLVLFCITTAAISFLMWWVAQIHAVWISK